MKKKSKNYLGFMSSILVIIVDVLIGYREGKKLEEKLIKRRNKRGCR